MNYKEIDLKESQQAALEILKSIDKICRDLNIRYYLMYGTLIGAIRHNGFIPWDDDLDIGMFKDDYQVLERFFLSHDNSYENIYLDNPKLNQKCFFNITRACDSEHKLVFKDMQYESGAFIDIYILEGLGKSQDLPYWKQRFKSYPHYQKMIYMACKDNFMFGSSTAHKLLNIPQCMYAKIIGKSKYFDKFNDHKKFAITDSDYVGVPAWENQIYRKDWFNEVIEKNFEDGIFYIPSGYKEFLTYVYGDYMKLPPESERHPYHGYKAYKIIY